MHFAFEPCVRFAFEALVCFAFESWRGSEVAHGAQKRAHGELAHGEVAHGVKVMNAHERRLYFCG